MGKLPKEFDEVGELDDSDFDVERIAVNVDERDKRATERIEAYSETDASELNEDAKVVTNIGNTDKEVISSTGMKMKITTRSVD